MTDKPFKTCPQCSTSEFNLTPEPVCANCRTPLPKHDLWYADLEKQRMMCNCGRGFKTLEELCEHCGVIIPAVAHPLIGGNIRW